MKKKILTIGIPDLPPGIDQKSWKEVIDTRTNISDFDIVFVDFSSLPSYSDTTLSEDNKPNQLSEQINRSNFEGVFRKAKILELLEAKGQLIFFINSDKRISEMLNNFLSFEIFTEYGDTIIDVDQSFKSYFEKIKKWNMCFDVSPTCKMQSLFFEKEPLAKNKAKKLLGVKLINLYKNYYSSSEFEGDNQLSVSRSLGDKLEGNIFILHTMQSRLNREIPQILKNIFDCSLEKDEPEWSKEIQFEKLSEIMENIKKLEQSEKNIQAKIRDARNDCEKMSEYKKLLWATGHSLEEIIHFCFNNDFNLQISKPEKGEHDGIFEFNSTIYMVEIKSGENRQAGFEDFSKLLARMEKYTLANPQKRVKGLFIMNHFANSPVNKRGEPFSDQVKKHADSVILLTSPELYDIVIDHLHEKISKNDAIKKILKMSLD